MQDEKSQIQNRAKAMSVLRARLLKLEQDRQAAELSDARRGQVGGGGRSEKIRTYNFKENRVTDHRIGLTLYKLDKVLAGELDEVIDALVADERSRQLQDDDRRPDRQAAGSATGRSPGPSCSAEAEPGWPTPGSRRRRSTPGASSSEAGGLRGRRLRPRPRRAGHHRAVARLRRDARPAARRRAAAVRARALGVPHARPARRPAGADPPARDRAGRRAGRSPSSIASGAPVRRRPPAAGRRRPRHRLGRDRPVARRRASRHVEVWATDVVGRRARRGPRQPGRPGRPGPAGAASPRARGSTRCPPSCGAGSTWSSATRPTSPPPTTCRPRSPTGSRAARWSPGRPGSRRCSTLVDAAPRWLARPGALVVELAPDQADAVADAARARRLPTRHTSRSTSAAAPAPSSPASTLALPAPSGGTEVGRWGGSGGELERFGEPVALGMVLVDRVRGERVELVALQEDDGLLVAELAVDVDPRSSRRPGRVALEVGLGPLEELDVAVLGAHGLGLGDVLVDHAVDRGLGGLAVDRNQRGRSRRRGWCPSRSWRSTR